MEQTTQQSIQKPSLPNKTKMAAWWIIIIGGIWSIYLTWVIGLSLIFIPLIPSWGINSGVQIGIEVMGAALLIPSLFFLIPIPGFFILMRKRWAWWVSIIIYGLISFYFFSRLFTVTIFLVSLNAFDYCYLLSFLVPFILLLLDRKNFFKIAS
jgi:hypothetical protein